MLAQTTGSPLVPAQQASRPWRGPPGPRARQDDVDAAARDSLAGRAGREDRLVAEPLDDVREQVAHLGLGLAHKDPHDLTIGLDRADRGGIWYGSGMKEPRRGHVLVVDDDPDIRGLLKELLERQGYGVTEASNGKEALRALYSTTPDVVLLDVSMPELDGWQTLERIRDLSDVPVAMLTARAAELEKVRGLKAGADDYITKPFGRQELLARVEAMLRRAGPREEAKRDLRRLAPPGRLRRSAASP